MLFVRFYGTNYFVSKLLLSCVSNANKLGFFTHINSKKEQEQVDRRGKGALDVPRPIEQASIQGEQGEGKLWHERSKMRIVYLNKFVSFHQYSIPNGREMGKGFMGHREIDIN